MATTYNRPSYTNWGGAAPQPKQQVNTLVTALNGTAGTSQPDDQYAQQSQPTSFNWGGQPAPTPTQPAPTASPSGYAPWPVDPITKSSPMVQALYKDYNAAVHNGFNGPLPYGTPAPQPYQNFAPQSASQRPPSPPSDNVMRLDLPQQRPNLEWQPDPVVTPTKPTLWAPDNLHEATTPSVGEFMAATGASLAQAQAALAAAPGTPMNWKAYMPNWQYDPMGMQNAAAIINNSPGGWTNWQDNGNGQFKPNAPGVNPNNYVVPMFTSANELNSGGAMNQFMTVGPNNQLYGNLSLPSGPYDPNWKQNFANQALQYGVGPQALDQLAKQLGFADFNSISDTDLIKLKAGMGITSPVAGYSATSDGIAQAPQNYQQAIGAGLSFAPNPTQSQWQSQFGPQYTGNALMDAQAAAQAQQWQQMQQQFAANGWTTPGTTP